MSLAVLDLEVLFHLSYTETEVECLKTLAVESLTATDSLGMPWRSCRLTTASSWHCPNHRWLSWSRDDWTSPSRSQWGNWTCGSLSAQHCCGWCAWDGKGAHCPEIRTLNCYKSIIIHPLKSRLTDSTECPVGCTTSIGCGLTTAWLHWALSCFHWKSQSLKVECALGWLLSRWIVWHHWPRNWKAHVRISLQRTGRTHCTDCQSGSDVGFQAHWHHLWVPVRRAGDCIGDWSIVLPLPLRLIKPSKRKLTTLMTTLRWRPLWKSRSVVTEMLLRIGTEINHSRCDCNIIAGNTKTWETAALFHCTVYRALVRHRETTVSLYWTEMFPRVDSATHCSWLRPILRWADAVCPKESVEMYCLTAPPC